MTGERDRTRPGNRRGGVAPVVGVALLCVTVALSVVGVVLLFAGGDFNLVTWGLPGGSGLWALGFSVAAYPIILRHPANAVGWCLMVAGVAAGVNTLGLGLPNAADPGGPALWLVNAWVVSVVALSTAVAIFPSGRPLSRWWLAQLGLLWVLGCLEYFKAYETSAGFIGLPEWLDPFATPVNFAFQISLAAGLVALLVRWRRSRSVERQQLKWVVYSAALVAISAPVVEVGIVTLIPAWYLPGTIVINIAILAVPVTIGVAMLRYRLYDIDAVINRTLVYGALTVTLVLVYFGSVVGLQYILRNVAGQESQLAVVASTLVIAALFNPLRRRIQGSIDRLFYRRKYDAAKTLEEFSAKLRNETDLHTLNTELVTVVRETMQPEHVTLWIRPGAGLQDRLPDGRA